MPGREDHSTMGTITTKVPVRVLTRLEGPGGTVPGDIGKAVYTSYSKEGFVVLFRDILQALKGSNVEREQLFILHKVMNFESVSKVARSLNNDAVGVESKRSMPLIRECRRFITRDRSP
jgi:hypothetical protein